MMLMKRVLPILLTLLFLTACSTKQKEHSQPQAVEEQADTVKSEYPIYDRLLTELDSTEIYNDSILCGYWFQPHAASAINIFFHKDNTYEFKYCKNGEGDEVISILKKGIYTINGEVITLTSDEGWDDYFNGVIYYKSNGTNYYLTDKKEGFYLVKGSD